MYLKTDNSLINLSVVPTIFTKVNKFMSYDKDLKFKLFIVYLVADHTYYIPTTVIADEAEAENLAKEVMNELTKEMMTDKAFIELNRFPLKFYRNDDDIWKLLREYARSNN